MRNVVRFVMRNVVRLALLAAVSLIPLQEARAVYSYSGIWYFEATNEEWAAAESIPDYNESAYYDIVVDVWIGAEGVGGAGGQGGCSPFMSGCGTAYASAVLPHHPDAEYELSSTHTVTPYVSDHTGSIWYDYYGYSYNYGSDDPLIYPQSYYFTQGGTQQAGLSSILLGYLIAVASGGTMHGPPHHLKLVSDEYLQTSCGSKRRWLKFQPVDSSGRFAGRIRIEETFTDPFSGGGLQSWYNACQDDNFAPDACGDMGFPKHFIDQLWAGCPSAGGDCGFEPPLVQSRWWWCPQASSFGKVSLSANIYSVRHNFVAVNGRETPYPSGTQFY